MNYNANFLQLAATDLSNHLGCSHLTQLNRKAARGELTRPFRNDPSLEVLEQRGREHEAAFVKYLERKDLSVLNLQNQPIETVIESMRKGIDVLVQAKLQEGIWTGNADVLIKVPGKSKFGDWSYEVYDTKLSQTTKAGTILQLCLYSDLLQVIQGATPLRMYVVKPSDDFEPEEYSFADFRAYYKLVKKSLEQVIEGPDINTYPEPVQHCDVCNWWTVCNKKRHDDDYLSLVAGIRTLHIEELKKQSIQTLEKFANVPSIEISARGNKETFLRKQQQAKIQYKGRVQDQLLYDVLPVEKDRGLNRLPEPDRGDIYFDIEGDAFYPGGGLEYMLGYAFKEKEMLNYRKYWAINRLEEKRAFEAFMSFVVAKWKAFPNLHIYHFAPYEPTSIKRLASTHAVFEQEVDELLRAEKFVDLHAIFKEALLASVEQYSLKALERFTTYTRKIDLQDASLARKNVECALELNEFKSLAKETILNLELYNEDDCLATQALHAWLENLRTSLIKTGHEFQRPVPQTQEPNEDLKKREIRSLALFTSLTKNLPEDRLTWTEEDQAKWLLAHQVDYFRREDKTAWWEHFRIHQLEHEELLDERKAVTGLRFIKALPPSPKKKTQVHSYSYPSQEIGLSVGDILIEINSRDEANKVGREIGSIESIALENNTVNIRKRIDATDLHPHALHVYDRIDPGTLWDSLMSLAQAIDDEGLERKFSFQASKDLLMKRKPRLSAGKEGADLLQSESVAEGAIRIALNLDKSILPIQGPPGAGKTHTGAQMIIELVKAKKKIGVTAISHRVITTLFEKVKELSDKENYAIEFVHKITNKMDYMPEWIDQIKEPKKVLEAVNQGKLVGGTAWLWSSNEFVETVDYLFIDEAGQMSLSQSLAASRSAKNIVLLGDPQQLEQPQRGSHPEGSDVAALTYLLDGNPTMPKSKGLFLDVTYRMHPAITQFTSEMFYESKLNSQPGLENQTISGGTLFDGAGLFHVPINHTGNQNSSGDEVLAISKIVAHLIQLGYWTDAKSQKRKMTPDDILIVAPYNAQVAALKEKIPGAQIGTVDKFQGKEAPVVIYSMTSSTVQDAPRGMSFLFSPNRLNVATSRAKSTCILVSSPRILEPECHTIDQMRWGNSLCRFKELATTIQNLL